MRAQLTTALSAHLFEQSKSDCSIKRVQMLKKVETKTKIKYSVAASIIEDIQYILEELGCDWSGEDAHYFIGKGIEERCNRAKDGGLKINNASTKLLNLICKE